MKYIIGIVALGLIVLDIIGFSISPFSYGVFGLASLVLMGQKDWRVKKAKAFGMIELEFEDDSKELIDKTIDVSNEIIEDKRIESKKQNPEGLNGLPNTENLEENEPRFKLDVDYNLIVAEKSEELIDLVKQLHSLFFPDNSKPLNSLIEDFRRIDFEHKSYLNLLEQFIRLKDKFLHSDLLSENPKYFKRLNFTGNQLINFTRILISQTGSIRRYHLN